MKRQTLVIAILILILPAIVRGVWFYRGVATRSVISTPDYASFSRPEAVISTPDMKDAKPLGGTVLVDAYHGNQFTLNEIDSLTSAIEARGGLVDTVSDATTLGLELKYASAFISVSPTLSFSQVETQALKSFADRGGRILVFTDATRNSLYYDYISGNPIAYGDSNSANSLLKFFDIAVNNDYLYNTQKNEGNFRNVTFNDFGKNELTFGLSEVALYGSHSVESASGTILLQGPATNLSSLDDAHKSTQGGAALNADGNVAAFGDFTFLSSPYDTYTDNAKLIQNLADFALGGTQTKTLANFPYLFTGKSVQIYVAKDLTRTTELVSALGTLQTALRYQNIELEFVDSAPKSGDAILVSTYDSAADEVPSYLKKFDIEFDGGDFVTTSEFGEVGRYGTSILLFDSGKTGNTLVLLADTSEDTISTITTLSSGSLYACLTSDHVGVCSVGYGGDYSGSSTETPTDATGSGSTPEVTPTPSG